MDSYDSKSCNALEKAYYKPIEAALRWCGLVEHEEEILRGTGNGICPGVGVFPRWPCLRANAEKIYDAILNGEIPHGRDGRTVPTGDQVSESRKTIRHTDLKAWMARHYPDQKPKFLFDEVERTTHSAINVEAFKALQVDRDALKVRIENATDAYRALKKDRDAIESERASLASTAKKMRTPGQKEETTYLNIIGSLVALIKSPRDGRDTDAAVIRELLNNYPDKQGISKRTLEDVFPAARRSLESD